MLPQRPQNTEVYSSPHILAGKLRMTLLKRRKATALLLKITEQDQGNRLFV